MMVSVCPMIVAKTMFLTCLYFIVYMNIKKNFHKDYFFDLPLFYYVCNYQKKVYRQIHIRRFAEFADHQVCGTVPTKIDQNRSYIRKNIKKNIKIYKITF